MSIFSSRHSLLLIAVALLPFLAVGGYFWSAGPSRAMPNITVYKSPTCGCCGKWVDLLKSDGFRVTVKNQYDLSPLKARLGVPDKLASCHTGVVDGYLVEGHVPIKDIRRLIKERPKGLGIAVPGMPLGSPGMEVPSGEKDPYKVILFGKDQPDQVFATH